MSTLSTLRTLCEGQMSLGETNSSSTPSTTQLDDFINKAIRKITREMRPRELESATVSTANITSSSNTVSIPSDIFIPDLVYYKYSGGTIQRLQNRSLKQMIALETAKNFFSSSNTGDPNFYTVRGTSLLFNKYFGRTATDAIYIYGLGFPTTLSSDSDTTELPIDYDMLICYETAVYVFQLIDDPQNQQKYQILAQQERANLEFRLDTNDEDRITLDPDVFIGESVDISNPNVFFSS